MIRSLLGIEKAPIKLDIQLSRDHDGSSSSVQAGKRLKGKVVLEVKAKKPIPGEAVKLFITGREAVKVAADNGQKQKSERVFCLLDLKLSDFCGRRLGPGRVYTFPFSIKLPEELPSSTRFKNKIVDLRVQYKILANAHNISEEREVIVTSAPLPDERVPCMIQPVSQRVKSLNLIDQGILTLAASVRDTHIGRGDELMVNISCRNESYVDIQRVEVKVYETVCGDIKPSRDGDFDDDKSFDHILYLKKDVKLDGILKKRAKKRDVEMALHRSKLHISEVQRGDLYAGIYEELINNTHTFTFICPDTARDSYSGRLVHVKHFLKIKLMTNSVTDNPSVIIPLKIGCPPVINTTQPSDGTNVTRAQSSPNLPQPPQDAPGLQLTSAPALPPNPLPPAIPAPARTRHLPSTQDGPASNDLLTLRTQSADALPDPPSSLPERSSGSSMSASTPVLPSAPPPFSAPAYNEVMDIPLVPAIPVPSDAVEACTVSVSPDVIVLGGDAILKDYHATGDFYTTTPTARQRPPAYAPSLNNLYEEMLSSVKDYDIIKGKLGDSGWKTLFGNMSANDFGTIIAHVNVDFDQPRVATLLASVIHTGRGSFTCSYCAAAVRSTSEWNRSTMAEHLAPFCADLIEGQHLILTELSEWDQVITERAIRTCLEGQEQHC